MLHALLLIATVGAGLVGGVFFAFSTFVMRALAELPAEAGVRAMQRINVVVINPLFMGAFVGMVPVALAAAVLAAWGGMPGALAALAAPAAGAVLYVAGTFGVTLAFNVPRNERLARLDAAGAEAAAWWPLYVREWLRWNHVRTAASLAAAACFALALRGV